MTTPQFSKSNFTVHESPHYLVRKLSQERRNSVGGIIIQLVMTLIMMVNAFLFLRFIFTAASAGESNALTRLVTSVTQPLVQPFFDLFDSSIKYGSGQIEFETLMAIGVYSLIARAIIRLVEQSSEARKNSPL